MAQPDKTPSAADGSDTSPAKNAEKAPADGTVKTKEKKPKHQDGTRDTIESILFAFVLAFLFRTFEAEAFVIPTGSMAPTLYGRHKETTCTACGHHVTVGASQEVVPETGYLMHNVRMRGAVCDNCGAINPQIQNELAFNGDRILVNKFPYEFSEPDRWDVFVFKYPLEPQTNYIKRLVGLPGEKIRIRNGNLYRIEDQREIILRKTPEKQSVLQIPVYNDRHPPKALLQAGWPERWAAVANASESGDGEWAQTNNTWTQDSEKRSFTISKENSASPSWLRYRHYFPMPQHWQALEHGLPLSPEPRLIGDFCGYNSNFGDAPFDASTPNAIDFGAFWVPDLTVHFTMTINETSQDSELTFESVEGTSWYRCRVNPTSGEATLEEINSQLNGRVRQLATGKTSIKGKGTYHISYANVDDRLCLWVNNKLVDFGEGALIDDAGATKNPFPTRQDLAPVGIAAKNVSVTVTNLNLERDIFYRVGQPRQNFQHRADQLQRFMNDPERWAEVFESFSKDVGERTFELPKDHFLAFGDNSPQSNDSRLWDAGHESVPRHLLVGKAFWIYWPHGVPFGNNGKGYPITYHYQHAARDGFGSQGIPEKLTSYPRYAVPFYPQFSRMKRIR